MQKAANKPWKLRRQEVCPVTLAFPECSWQHEQQMWDLFIMSQNNNKKGWGNKQKPPPALLEPPLQEQPCRWRTHVSCQRENTQINAFLQGLLIFFLGQLENPSQWCQIIPLCVPGDKKKIHPTAEIVSCSASSSNTLKGLSATCFSTKVNLVASFLNS